jgi:hypothetical protein
MASNIHDPHWGVNIIWDDQGTPISDAFTTAFCLGLALLPGVAIWLSS